MSSVSKKLKSAKFPFRDVSICLNRQLGTRRDELIRTRGPVAARVEEEKEGKARDTRLGVGGAAAELRRIDDQITTVENAMRDASITIRITGVSFTDYNGFITANPPRKDKQEQFNYSTFYIYVARRTGTSVEPDGSVEDITDQEWDDIEAALTDGEHDRLATAIVAVNRTEGIRNVDFLSTSSDTTLDSSETSEPPAASA